MSSTKKQKRSVTMTLLDQGRFIAAVRWYLSSKLGFKIVDRVKVDNVDLYMRSSTPDFWVAKSCVYGEFDEVIEVAGDIGDGLIIDAGGYIGTAAIMFAKAYPAATVITVEPSIDNFRILRRNIAGYSNILAINKALGAEPGTMELRNLGSGEWGFSIVDSPADSSDAAPMHKIEMITVDEILDMTGKTEVAIIKIDIEGGEHALFSKNMGWLDRTRILCIELHDWVREGCTTSFERVTVNRKNWQLDGEKIISVSQ